MFDFDLANTLGSARLTDVPFLSCGEVVEVLERSRMEVGRSFPVQ